MSVLVKQKIKLSTALYSVATVLATASAVFGYNKFLGNLATITSSNRPKINYFYAQPNRIVLGTPTTLYWSCSPSDVYIEVWNQNKGWLLQSGDIPSGSLTDYPNEATYYLLKCTYGGTFLSKSISVSLDSSNTRPQLDFSANPQNITRGEASVLRWSTINAQACTASGAWSGNKSISGSETVYPTKTSTYKLKCSNQYNSVDQSITITVGEPRAVVNYFYASPETIAQGEKSVLYWSSSNASSCILQFDGSSNSLSSSGSYNIYPQKTTTYYLNCSGKGGTSNTVNTTVTVTESCSYSIYKETGFKLYPNPASYDITGEAIIHLPQCLKSFRMKIYDTGGRLKYDSYDVTSSQVTAYVYNLSNGTYKATLLARIYTDSKKSNSKSKSMSINFTVLK